MNDWAIGIFRVLVNLAVIQIPFTVGFVMWLQRRNRQLAWRDGELPKVTVILYLSQISSSLPQHLEALLNQNYSNYQLHLILNSPEDPAWAMIKHAIADRLIPLVRVSYLKIRPTCTLQCSALVQAVSTLDRDCEVLALVDGNTIPHSDWLSQLVSPLGDSRIGVTTGNCWYLPGKSQWGSALRYLWNVSAVVQMFLHRIPWRGSLAIRTQLLEETRLLCQWERSLGEDAILYRLLKQQGLKLKFVPGAILVNSQECNFSQAIAWMKHQLLMVRLYHPRWLAVVSYGAINTLIPAIAGGMLLFELFTRQWDAIVWLAGGLGIYLIVMFLLVGILEIGIQKAIGKPRIKFSIPAIAKLLFSIPIAQVVYGITLFSSLFSRNLKLHGITYRIQGPWKIRLVGYHSPVPKVKV